MLWHLITWEDEALNLLSVEPVELPDTTESERAVSQRCLLPADQLLPPSIVYHWFAIPVCLFPFYFIFFNGREGERCRPEPD